MAVQRVASAGPGGDVANVPVRADPGGSGARALTDVIGGLPYRLALAGGWIDQPFLSELDPAPPGSMVVVSLEPTVRFMDRSGMATGTRTMARAIWGDELPAGDPLELVRELYRCENENRSEPSGSQDMAGIVFPGISRLDYDSTIEGGFFPCHVESTSDPTVAHWLEQNLHLIAVAPRPPGYAPLGRRRLESRWVRRLGQSGRDCFDAILARDVAALGSSMNVCTRAWEALLPDVLEHPTITIDLKTLLATYQAAYPGAMYSGCGGGYLVVASERAVPGSFSITVRTE